MDNIDRNKRHKNKKTKQNKTNRACFLRVERVVLIAEGIIDTSDTLGTLDVRQLTKVVVVGRG